MIKLKVIKKFDVENKNIEYLVGDNGWIPV